MFNVKLYTTFILLFIIIFFFILSTKTNHHLILDFMNSYEFKEIVVSKSFQVENGILWLERDMYLIIVKFLDE
jgi:hypothetical protein